MRISDWSSDVCSSDLEQRLVALVVGVGHHGDAGREQLRAGRVDEQRGAVGTREHELVVGAGQLAVGQLGLRDGRLHVDVPQGRRLAAVGEVALGEAQEAALRGAYGLGPRSEEHTSELQSLMRPQYAVFCLKKKTCTRQPT